jgi:hypothetical protein
MAEMLTWQSGKSRWQQNNMQVPCPAATSASLLLDKVLCAALPPP